MTRPDNRSTKTPLTRTSTAGSKENASSARAATNEKCAGLAYDANCHTYIIQRQVNKRGKKSETCFGSLPTVSLASLCHEKQTLTRPTETQPGLMWMCYIQSHRQFLQSNNRNLVLTSHKSPQRPTPPAPGASDLPRME
ncbi:hypothetical protein R3I93_015282 [Phoxinus phoxinus]|uniref:Uncharacterized protein n=1 Tax=Phoxinus phoxinus TaxID=58324 RepID=A0AAN9CQT9_9TELE